MLQGVVTTTIGVYEMKIEIETPKGIVEFDDSKNYLDFFIHVGHPTLATINFGDMLRALSLGEIPIDEEFKNYLIYLERWTREAPRKRFYRELKLRGVTVLCDECWFEEEDGTQIINDLENTGLFAKYLLNIFFVNWEPLLLNF